MKPIDLPLIEAIGPGGLISDGDWIESKDQDPSGKIRLIQLADIGDGNFLNKSRRFVTSETASRLRCTILIKGDVLIARLPDPIGRACLFPGLNEPAIAAVDVCIIRPNPEHLRPEWLVGFINSPKTREEILKHVQGATRARVPTGKLKQLRVVRPPIVDQTTLINSLEATQAKYGCAMNALQEQRAEVTRLTHSIIYQSLISSGIKKMRIGDILEEVKNGIGDEWKAYPVLGATRQGLAPAKEQPGKTPQRYKPAFPGTVFYNPMRIMIGSVAYVDDDDTPGITSPDYVVLRGKPGVTDSRWFYHWLRSPRGEQCISSLAREAVRERMLFNRLAEGEIELPDFSSQERASKALAAIKPMRTALEKQLKELELMPKKLLARVFES